MKTRNILIVEDEMIVAADIKARLTLMGYAVCGTSASGEKALALVEQTAPDVILMDIHLAGEMDGITTAQEIRRRFQLPVIFLTAYSEDSTIQRAKLTEPFGFLLKPFEDRALKTTIELALYRHQADFEHVTTTRLLEICNGAATTRALMQHLTAFFQQVTRCEAVGVRLRKGDDFPYFETRGFSQEFVQAETNLCRHDLNSRPVIDHQGNPVLDCMCGNVILGRITPGKPFITPNGSFWTNSTSELLASTSETDRNGRTRNRCNGEGYESVALIPLRYHGKTFGLFQFNDRHKGRFTLERIEHLERLVNYVAIALSKQLDEESLRENESRFRALFNATTDAVYAFTLLPDNRPGTIIEANDVACRMLGYNSQELIGMSVDQIDDPETRVDIPGIIARLQSGDNLLFRNTHIARNGQKIPVEVHARVFEYRGQPTVLATVRDVSERLKSEEERLRMEREIQQNLRIESLGVMAGGVAHDFNNLLMAIQGHADLGLFELPPGNPVRDNLEAIVRSSRRAADLCKQMLAFAGQGRFVVEPVRVNDLLESLTPLLRTTIADHSSNTALSLSITPSLPPFEASAPQLRQIIVNLVTNSAEALGESAGIIGISAGIRTCTREDLATATLGRERGVGEYLVIEVSDNGPGMDSHTLERLFDPFFTTKFMGRGLGLPAVLGIVRSHKGALKVVSEPGKGTTVSLYFPIGETANLAAAEPLTSAPLPSPAPGAPVLTPPATSSPKPCILLVDDEEEIRSLGERMLTRLGYRVLTAENGREAVKLYDSRTAPIDLVLLDLTMPVMDGVETFHCLQVLDPEVAIVIVSGYSDKHIRERVAGKALRGILEKPYSSKKLKDVVSEALPPG